MKKTIVTTTLLAATAGEASGLTGSPSVAETLDVILLSSDEVLDKAGPIITNGLHEGTSPNMKRKHKPKIVFGKKAAKETADDKKTVHRHGEKHVNKKRQVGLSQKEKDQKHIRTIRKRMYQS